MRVTMLLADAAQIAEGKLYILGGGWSVVGPQATPMAIAIKVEVPWTEANAQHRLKLSLVDEDERPVMKITEEGPQQPYQVTGSFEVGRPPGLPPGTPLDIPFAINMGPLSLPPGRYTWRCFIDDHTEDDWQVSFLMRSSPPPARGTS